MMLAWMAYATLAAAALGLSAWLVDFALAGRVGQRRVLWAVVFVASAVGPIVFSTTRGSHAAVAAEENVGAASAASGRTEPIVSDRVLGSAWLLVSAVVALWFVGTQRRLRRKLRGCSSRIVDGERVLVSSGFGPAVVGVVHPRIVLPEWTLAMHESDRRIIVAHETEHRQAHDPLLAAVALIVVAALPWNVALWWQLRRLRLAIEIDCDRRVVARHSHDACAYGMLLLSTRERASGVTPALAMAMAPMRSGLGRRIEALLGGRPRSTVRRMIAVMGAVVLATGFVSVPAPRLSMVRAAVIDAPVAKAPLAVRSLAVSPAAPPAPRQDSSRSAVADTRPRTAPRTANATPKRSVVPATATPAGNIVQRSGDSTRLVVPPGVPAQVRMMRTSTGATRMILLPARDSVGSPPP
ncbi:MAG: M56 family metallopeptidase [Gemmatimonadota bacterium]